MSNAVVDFPDNSKEPNAAISSILLRTLSIIEKRNPQIAELMRAVAIPHRFNSDVIDVLQVSNSIKIASDEVLNEIRKFSFVYKDELNLYTYHESIRSLLLEFWRSNEQRERYTLYSDVLMSYYQETNNENEVLYHLFVVNQDEAFHEFRKRISTPIKNYDLADAEVLIRLAQDQRWNLLPAQQIWVDFYEATLKRLLSEWKDAIAEYENILSKQDLSSELRATTLHGLGSCLNYIGKWLDAKKVLEESVSISKNIGNNRILENALLTLGWCNFRLGEYSSAINAFENVLDRAKESDDIYKQGWAYSNLGRVYRGMKSWHKAIECYEQSLNVRRQVKNNELLIGASLTNLAMTYLEMGEWSSALPYVDEAHSILVKQNDKFRYAIIIATYGLYFQKSSQFEKAIENYNKALEIFSEMDAKKEIFDIYSYLVDAYTALDMKEEADLSFRKAAQIELQLQQHSDGSEND